MRVDVRDCARASKERLIALPWASSALAAEPVLSSERGALHLAMQFGIGGGRRRARLIFGKQRAFRKRSEVHCSPWHVEGALDTVCEVRCSDWTRELAGATTRAWRNRWVMRHFILYLTGFGCIEVAAESVALAVGGNAGDPGRRGVSL